MTGNESPLHSKTDMEAMIPSNQSPTFKAGPINASLSGFPPVDMSKKDDPYLAPYEGLMAATSADLRYLTCDESKAYLLLAGIHGYGVAAERAETIITEYFLAKVMAKRLEYFGVPYDRPLVAFLSLLCSTPAQAVMWAHYVTRLGRKIDGIPTIMDFSTDTFAKGVPTDDFYAKAWNAQKMKGNNRLDYDDRLWI